MKRLESAARTGRPRRTATLAVLITAFLLVPPGQPPAAAETPHAKTAQRRSNDCQLLLTEKRLLGFDVSRASSKVRQARKTGMAGNLAGALRQLDETELELRRCDFPWNGPPGMIMITGTPLPSGYGNEKKKGPSIGAGDLNLHFDDSGQITGMAIGTRELGSGTAGGFYVVDAATGKGGPLLGRITGDETEIRFTGETSAVQATIEATFRRRDNRLEVEGTLRGTAGTDQALVLCFKVPFRGRGFSWWDDADLAVEIPASACVLQNSAPMFLSGATGRLVSTYPLACIGDGRDGLVLGTAIDHPAAFRLAWDGRDQSLNLCYEFGLTSKTVKFPGEARFRFVIYPLEEPAWGFRSALASYYRIYPRAFTGRAENAGLWGTVNAAAVLGREYKEMGFAYLQGENENPRWGRKLGLWSLRYCRPWSFFVPGAAEPQRGRLTALAEDPLSLNLKPSHRLIFGQVHPRDLVSAVVLSVIHDGRGDPVSVADRIRGGVNYVLNPDPEIEGAADVRNTARITLEEAIEPTVHNRYQAHGQTRWGLFFDVAGTLLKYDNFRQDHMAFADYPLAFDHEEKRPVILGLSSACEYLSQARTFAHNEGGMVGVNTSPHPYNMVFLAPFCDMAGTEHFPGRREMNNRRALAWHKPIGFRTYESWDNLLKVGLFYGVFPSRVPPGKVRTNLDHLRQAKPLLTHLVPLIRDMATAGWEPVTRARTGDPDLLVERFGHFEAQEPVYLTVWNKATSEREVTLRLDKTAGRWCGETPRAAELAGGLEVETAPGVIRFRLGSDQVALIRLDAADAAGE